MHILDYLGEANSRIQVGPDSVVRYEHNPSENAIRVEYRLICSGALVPSPFNGDWSRSDRARILLQLPFELLVASQPYDDYPQELALRFVVESVTKHDGQVTRTFHPDDEIALDIAALLTLHCRRLVTVSTQVRAQYAHADIPAILADFPIPAVTRIRMSCWRRRPIQLHYTLEGVKARSLQPPPQPFASSEFIKTLLALPRLRTASAIVRAARLYAAAMEQIESPPETSYQLLISAIETIAGAALDCWEPSNEEKIASKSELVSFATKSEKLSKDVADRVALQACKGNAWSNRKFKKFILDNLDLHAIQGDDDLFIVPEDTRPVAGDIEQALGEIYRTRSGATHSGHSYPASAAIGPSTRVPIDAFDALLNQNRPFPPIGWFERVVNNAICAYIRSEVNHLPALSAP